MRCAMCHRPMLTAAVSIPSRQGPIGYGPKCAERAGLLVREKRPQIIGRRRFQAVRVEQVDWIEGAA